MYKNNYPVRLSYSLSSFPPLDHISISKIRDLRKEYWSRLRKRPDGFSAIDEDSRVRIFRENDSQCCVCKHKEKLLIHHQSYEPVKIAVVCYRCHGYIHSRNWAGDYGFPCPYCNKFIHFHPDLLRIELGTEIEK